MDYIAVTGLSPRYFIPTYDHYKFQGKGIRRLLINVIQILNLYLAASATTSLLNVTKIWKVLYKSIGFQKN